MKILEKKSISSQFNCGTTHMHSFIDSIVALTKLQLSLVIFARRYLLAYFCVHSDSVTRNHSCAVEGVTSPVESVSN